jgi:hypothetical protein
MRTNRLVKVEPLKAYGGDVGDVGDRPIPAVVSLFKAYRTPSYILSQFCQIKITNQLRKHPYLRPVFNNEFHITRN